MVERYGCIPRSAANILERSRKTWDHIPRFGGFLLAMEHFGARPFQAPSHFGICLYFEHPHFPFPKRNVIKNRSFYWLHHAEKAWRERKNPLEKVQEIKWRRHPEFAEDFCPNAQRSTALESVVFLYRRSFSLSVPFSCLFCP